MASPTDVSQIIPTAAAPVPDAVPAVVAPLRDAASTSRTFTRRMAGFALLAVVAVGIALIAASARDSSSSSSGATSGSVQAVGVTANRVDASISFSSVPPATLLALPGGITELRASVAGAVGVPIGSIIINRIVDVMGIPGSPVVTGSRVDMTIATTNANGDGSDTTLATTILAVLSAPNAGTVTVGAFLTKFSTQLGALGANITDVSILRIVTLVDTSVIPTPSPTSTGTSSSSGTATSTSSSSATRTSTSSSSGTATSTSSSSGTQSCTSTPTATSTQSVTGTSTSSGTQSITSTSSSSGTGSSTASSSATGSSTSSSTQSITSTSSSSGTGSSTASSTATGSSTSSGTQSITSTSSSSGTGSATATASATGTSTSTSTQSAAPAGAVVSTLAGGGSVGGTVIGRADGVGTAATLNFPIAICPDGSGNAYVTDYSNNLVRKVVLASGTVTTLAGGTSSGSTNGVGTQAQFFYPFGVAYDGVGNLFIADQYNHLIRQIAISSATVSTLAGSAGVSGVADGVGAAARFNQPAGIVYASGNLYVADFSSSLIRQVVVATATVSTLAGTSASGFTDGTGTSASFNGPNGIFLSSGNLYIADTFNLRIRQLVIATQLVTTVAGSTRGNTNAVGTVARFSDPFGITGDGAGNLYVADALNVRIRKIDLSTNTVTTVAGSSSGYVDAAGTNARFSRPIGIVFVSGKLYVADGFNNVVRTITL